MAHIRRRRLSTGKAAYLAVWRTPEGRERSRQFARRVDAQRWIHSVEVAKAEGRYVDLTDARQTLGDWAQRCWDPMTGHLAPKSKARSDEVLRVHVLPRFGSTPLARIDKVAIAEWTTELHRECGLSPETVRKALWELSRLLAAAVETKRLGANPAKGLKLPKVERQEMRVLAPEELCTLLDVLDHRFRAWGLLAAYSGLRAGELFGLRRGRFDALRAHAEGGPDVGGTRVDHDHLRPIRTPLSRYREACHECARARPLARSRATNRRHACVLSAPVRVGRPWRRSSATTIDT